MPDGPEDLSWRLAGVEDRLDAISERLGRLESTVRSAVADEVGGATAELRRAITELGRRLVQDLPHELARHRDAIVAELRVPVPPAAPPVAEPPPEPETGDEVPVADSPDADDGGRRAHRLRRGRS